MLAADALGEVADHLIGHFVDQARRSGASWTDIGTCMGVTKQAAQKRFVPRTETNPLDAGGGFSRFTPRARNVVVESQNAAHAAGNDEIRPAHLLRALFTDPNSLAVRLLTGHGVDSDAVAGAAPLPPSVDALPALIPFSGPAKKVLELTFREALRLGPQLHRHRTHPPRPPGSRGTRRPAPRSGRRQAAHRDRPGERIAVDHRRVTLRYENEIRAKDSQHPTRPMRRRHHPRRRRTGPAGTVSVARPVASVPGRPDDRSPPRRRGSVRSCQHASLVRALDCRLGSVLRTGPVEPLLTQHVR